MEIEVEKSKEGNMSLLNDEMNFKEFLDTYKKSNLYMVHTTQDEMNGKYYYYYYY